MVEKFCVGCGILINVHGGLFNLIAQKVYGDKPEERPVVFVDGLYCAECSKKRRKEYGNGQKRET